MIGDAQPNAAHHALAQLERAGILHTIITQNIDGLHQRAGSTHVAEVHGHVREATCMHCYHTVSTEKYLPEFINDGVVPYCPRCGGILKPNITLFGEALPAQALLAAVQAVRRCDVMLVAGSSLEVAPASNLPELALAQQARLIIVNLGATYLDASADVLIHDDVAVALPHIVARLDLPIVN